MVKLEILVPLLNIHIHFTFQFFLQIKLFILQKVKVHSFPNVY